jgi:hypothetical protein
LIEKNAVLGFSVASTKNVLAAMRAVEVRVRNVDDLRNRWQ